MMTTATNKAPATKKSFFKRPTWATSTSPTVSGDFFRHSDTVYDRILREKEERKERHARRGKAEVGIEALRQGRTTKRRKITINGESKEEDEQGDPKTATTGSWSDETADTEIHVNGSGSGSGSRSRAGPAQAGRPSPSKVESSVEITAPVESKVIVLDSDDDVPRVPSVLPGTQVRVQSLDEEVSEDEDEYVLELKQKAREKARLRQLGVESVGDRDRMSRPSTPQRPSPLPSQHHSPFAQKPAALVPSPRKDDLIVQILITTEIPNAKPLLVSRKVSQSMQQVREVWCARQNFDEDMTAMIIFTWRGKRLYDTSTSTHLLNVLRRERASRIGGLADDDEEDPSNGRIEVKAMTKDMYEQESRRKNWEEPQWNTEAHVQDDQSLDFSTKPEEPEYTIVMNAQGLESLYLKVRPGTAISKMMAAFKQLRHVDPGKTCWLVHDGDRLELDAIVGDTEIEDGDAVEVHVR